MNYTTRDYLTIVTMEEQYDNLPYMELIPLLYKNPTCIVYFEYNGLLYGIISIGDIQRAYSLGSNYVKINKTYRYVLDYGYMQAREIFKHYSLINELPVKDKYGKLVGEYERSDEILELERFSITNHIDFIEKFREQYKKIILVNPSSVFKNRSQLFHKWKKIIETIGIPSTVVEPKDIHKYSEEDYLIMCIDSTELRCYKLLYSLVTGRELNRLRIMTYLGMVRSISELSYNKTIAELLGYLKNQGIIFLSMECAENSNGYLKKFMEKVDNKFKENNIKNTNTLLPEMKKEFLEGIYDDLYAEEEMPFFHNLGIKGRTYIIKDKESVLFNAKNGERVTIDQPVEHERCIYMFGPCTVAGSLVEDRHTIASWLQERINKEAIRCKVVNYGICGPKAISDFYKIIDTKLNTGDIVIWDNSDSTWHADLHINIIDIFEQYDIPVQWVTNDPRHCNYKVNKILADTIFEKLYPVLKNPVTERVLINKDIKWVYKDYIEKFFFDFDSSLYKSIGAIVMNCNPFTYGHRYLIEQAKSHVEYLIIFVVEEDKSLFSFSERFTMVCDGVADMENVKVVPSGEYILSQTTFPEYFIKIADEDIIKNVENDIRIFAEMIAPSLNIKYRFVGEELDDPVTNEYNNAMKKILPLYGISLIEIPRIEKNGLRIRATTVRECLENEESSLLDQLIPPSTKKLLFLKNT